jgi:prevent-host-death family protein
MDVVANRGHQSSKGADMGSVSVAEAKARLSALIKEVQGEGVCVITSGQRRKPVAVLVAYDEWTNSKPRIGGSLKDRMNLIFADDWYMSDTELLNS